MAALTDPLIVLVQDGRSIPRQSERVRELEHGERGRKRSFPAGDLSSIDWTAERAEYAFEADHSCGLR
jgi:hypothetical protein